MEPDNLKALVGVLRWHVSNNDKKLICEMSKRVKERATGTKDFIVVECIVVSSIVCHDATCENLSRFAKQYVPRILQHVNKKFCPDL